MTEEAKDKIVMSLLLTNFGFVVISVSTSFKIGTVFKNLSVGTDERLTTQRPLTQAQPWSIIGEASLEDVTNQIALLREHGFAPKGNPLLIAKNIARENPYHYKVITD